MPMRIFFLNLLLQALLKDCAFEITLPLKMERMEFHLTKYNTTTREIGFKNVCMDIVEQVVNFLSVHCFIFKLVFAVRKPGKEL